MIFTFGNTKAQLAPYVDTGKCATDPSVLTATNEAMMRLLMCDNWKLTVQKITFKVTHNSIVLPEFVDSVIALRSADAVPGRVWNQFYEFGESGPGQTTFNGNPGSDLIDLGNFCTFYPIEINSSLTLAFFSTIAGDGAKEIHVRGQSAGREALTDLDTGIQLKINRWRGGVEGVIDWDEMAYSPMTFSEVTHIVKPVTAGHVTLVAMDRTTKQMQILGVYQPWETTPSYRRYKIVNADSNNGNVMVCACKMRYVPLRHDNDPLILQNPPALIAMLQSMHQEKSRNIQAQVAFENKAMLWLQRQAIQLDDQQASMSVVVRDWGMGDAVNFR